MSRYDELRPEIKTGDCLLWANNTALGWLIRKFSHAPVNHASLIIRLELQGLKDRVWQLEALARGIEFHLVSRSLRNYGGRVYWLKLHDKYNPIRPGIAAWALPLEGTPYDYRSLFRNAVSRVNADARKFFCSEYLYMAYYRHRIVPRTKAPTPGGLLRYAIWQRIEQVHGEPQPIHLGNQRKDKTKN